MLARTSKGGEKMNYVKIESPQSKELCTRDLKSGETAFIGRCGSGPEHSLYLIVYQNVVLANYPNTTWGIDSCSVIVDRYCDIDITEKIKRC